LLFYDFEKQIDDDRQNDAENNSAHNWEVKCEIFSANGDVAGKVKKKPAGKMNNNPYDENEYPEYD
jgi:hypothetical protein